MRLLNSALSRGAASYFPQVGEHVTGDPCLLSIQGQIDEAREDLFDERFERQGPSRRSREEWIRGACHAVRAHDTFMKLEHEVFEAHEVHSQVS